VLSAPLKGRPIRRFTPVHGLSGRPDPRAAYIPFPVEPMPPGTERSYAPGGVVRILCVGKLTERRKNHFLLLRALEPLAQQFDFRVTLVGSSSLDIGNPDPEYFQSLQDYARQGPLAERMEIVTDVPFSEMPTIYRNHDLCVLPSRAEPLGTAPLEAMAQGYAAIISSDAGSAYYVLSGADAELPCGAVLEGGHQQALCRTMGDTFLHLETLASVGRNAAKWARMEFSLRRFVERFTIHVRQRLLPT
jgi:glycosyltransferase involved in cell wall biosynthesis